MTPLSDGWHVATARAGAVSDPAALERDPVDWCPAAAPSTAASALRDAGRWGLDDRVDFDAADWWYRCRFAADRRGPWAARALRFGGLATLAEVWLNG